MKHAFVKCHFPILREGRGMCFFDHLFNQIIKKYFRFVHVGPILTSVIYNGTSTFDSDASRNDTEMFDPLKILPISYNDTIVILCSNALDPSKSTLPVAINSIMLRYGFQVLRSKIKLPGGFQDFKNIRGG